MYNKSLIKNANKMKNIKKISFANKPTHCKRALATNATALTHLSSTTASSSSLSSTTPTLSSSSLAALITVMTLATTQQRQQKQMYLRRISSLLSCSNFLWTVILPLIIVCLQCPSVLAGSCREAQLCCNGRDSSCVVQKAPINAIIEDLSDKPCYCDHACLKLGDCCSDFKDHCGGKCTI